MKTLGIAIIGCGFAGNFHSNAWVKVNYIDIETTQIMYAAYVSADEGRRIDL